MRKKRAIGDRELQAEKILQQALPECLIKSGVRLADLIRSGNQFKNMRDYDLDFVICDQQENAIAAVEMDDTTHDTEDGKRRHALKQEWLERAGIILIRIREADEASQIRRLIKEYKPHSTEIDQAKWKAASEKHAMKFRTGDFDPGFTNTKISEKFNRHKLLSNTEKITLSIMAIVIVIWILNALNTKLSDRLDNKILMQQHYPTEELLAQRTKTTQPAIIGYRQVLIPGRTAEECSGQTEIMDSSVTKCMKSHYESQPVYGN